ncbi:MAG: hypothetical protein IIC50_00550 [Planctomycetes bacterium]|nr:hypothetical protein [Planctomycetota bacterium]
MIENLLREQLEPLVKRRKGLFLARGLGLIWLVAAVLGLLLIGVHWLWAWSSLWAMAVLCAATLLGTLRVLIRSKAMQPDYADVARRIEQSHPDLKAMIRAAIEQRPQAADGEFGYLQKGLIREAVVHATSHDWVKSVPTGTLVWAKLGRLAALALLFFVLAQLLPAFSLLPPVQRGVLAKRDYSVTVSPGDTTVELGAPVVIVARFDDLVPSAAALVYGDDEEELLRVSLAKNLNDPVFGGIVPEVTSNMVYHIEFAEGRSRDYRIKVIEHPALTRADAKIVYPAYTKLAEKLIADTRRVSVVEGSEVTLTFMLNKPVAVAQLVPKEGPPVELIVSAEHPNVYTTAFTAQRSERYHLHLTDARGLKNKMPPRFGVEVHTNLPPDLKPLFPNRDIVTSPLEELTLEAQITDDYGLTDYGLSFTLAGGQTETLSLGASTTDLGQQQTLRYLLALEDVNAQPDQLLTYHFWAEDIGPGGVARRTVSDMYFAEIRPFDEIFRESPASQNDRNQQGGPSGQQRNSPGQKLTQLQKEIIIATWNVKQQLDRARDANDFREDLEVVRDAQADALAQAEAAQAEAEDPAALDALRTAMDYMEGSLGHLSQAAEAGQASELAPALSQEQSAYQELLKLRAREHQIARAQGGGGGGGGGSARYEEQLRQLELTQEEDRYESQRLAQSQAQATQREELVVHNRLRTLARRQHEMAEKLKEAEAALRQARTEEEKEEIRRELKRLREEQIEALRDVDELQQRMDQSQNRQRMAEARQRLNETRERMQQSTEQLEQGNVSEAISSTTRAQRQLEELRDDFRRRSSSQFVEEMRELRDQVQALDRRQQEISEEIAEEIDPDRKSLADAGKNRELASRVGDQQQKTKDLLEQMRELSDLSEISEPLLSRKLYDTLREATTGNIDSALEITGELLRRNFLPQAFESERPAGEGIERMSRGVEEAARSVLGDDAEALRQARAELGELIDQVTGRRRADDPNDPNRPDEFASAQRGTGGENTPRQGRQQAQAGDQGSQGQEQAQEPGQGGQGQQPGQGEGQRGQGQQQARGQGQGGQGGQGGRGQRGQRSPAQAGGTPRDAVRAGTWADGRAIGGDPGGGATGPEINPAGPFTGGNFRQWSERLRDVEDMLTEPELRNEAANVRDRARMLRSDFTRHGKEPQWDLVQEHITRPLIELQKLIGDKLAQLQGDDDLVPIDRDPVPERYADRVRSYFEELGEKR